MRPKFRVGDVVEAVHHFDHFFRPSPKADGAMSGNLRAIVSKVSRSAAKGLHNRSAIIWLGAGVSARVLEPGSGPWLVDHCRGQSESWWDECALRLVRRRPKLPRELQLVLKTELGD